ncbi:efflux RND transporter permease subunit [Egicoccus sp. AB-alg2]|uniref:efflux RND transporter permease subunit n=1 Tax=Egicoccus sp. AB-alg2 TaxID=3242693 RepID=UPI00359DDA7C
MEAFVAAVLRRRSVVLLVAVGLAVAGLWAASSLRQEVFPAIETPYLVVTAVWPGADPASVADEVAEPIEDALEGTEGIEHVSSTSVEGLTIVSGEYEFGTDVVDRERRVRDNLAQEDLPDDVEDPEVQRVNPQSAPVFTIALTGGNEADLRTFAEDVLEPRLVTVDGVGQVRVAGGRERVVAVELDPRQSEREDVTAFGVVGALADADLSVPVGSLPEGDREATVRVTGPTDALDVVAAVPVGRGADTASLPPATATVGAGPAASGDPAASDDQAVTDDPAADGEPAAGDGGPGGQGREAGGQRGARSTWSAPIVAGDPDENVRSAPPSPEDVLLEQQLEQLRRLDLEVGDVAAVTFDDRRPDDAISTLGGAPSVTLEVIRQQDANTIEVVDGLQAQLTDVEVPAGITATEIVNQAPDVREAVSDLSTDALIGGALAVLVISLFLGSLRSTVVAGVSIPLSLLVALLAMRVGDLTLNILTLGALSVAAGRVIDDSIVVLENIARLREAGLTRWTAVITGTSQMVPAITASAITSCAVFVPLAFVGGLVGEVFVGFALTIVFALLASLAVAAMVVPALTSVLLPERAAERGLRTSVTSRLAAGALRPALRHRALTVLVALGLLAASAATLQFVPVVLFPAEQVEELEVVAEAPTGTSLEGTAQRIDALEAQLREVPGIERITAVIGSVPGAFGGARGVESATLTVTMADGADEAEVTAAIDTAVAETDLTGAVSPFAGIPGGSDISLQVSGDDFSQVQAAADTLVGALEQVDGLRNVESNLDEAQPEIDVEVDREEAADEGLTPATVAQEIGAMLSETEAATVDIDGDERPVEVSMALGDTVTVEELGELEVAPGVEVSEVATLTEVQGPTAVTRYDDERSAEVSGRITAENAGAVSDVVQQVVAAQDLPPGVSVSFGGITQQLNDSFSSLIGAMGVALVLVYLSLVATFGSLLVPLVMMGSIPLAAIGAFPLLWITGRELGLPTLIGLLMLIGIVVTNGIVLLEFVERLRREGRTTYDALVEAAGTRVRPILMTALTTIFALVPLALGLNEGALLSAGLATVVIGGLISSTALTLVVVPVIYSLVDDLRRWLLRTPQRPDTPTRPDTSPP